MAKLSGGTTVYGTLSAVSTVYASGGNSGLWNTAFQYVSSQSLNTTDNVEFNQVNANVYLSGGTNLLNVLSSSGGGGDPAVNTLVMENSANWDIAYINSAETFESVSKNLKTYPYTVNYTDNILTSVEYTLPDNKSIVKIFGYTNNILTTVSLSGDLPMGINTVKTLGYTVNNILTGATYS